MTQASLRMGMGGHYVLTATVVASADFDPTLPTGAVMQVTKPSGASASWAADLGAQSAASVVVSHTLDVLDLDEPGEWVVWVQWTGPGVVPGPRTETARFHVRSPDA